jgi:hypothetical protein
VLKTARDEKVKRVVLTSSFGALGFSNRDFSTVTTEANWTNPNDKGLALYHKSKTLAERAEGTEKVLLGKGGRNFNFLPLFLYLKVSKERHKRCLPHNNKFSLVHSQGFMT